MLVTIAVLLIALWALGLITKVAVGGFIHLLLLAAIVVFLLSVISGRRAI
jgi:predicted membrane metal-binding protein